VDGRTIFIDRHLPRSFRWMLKSIKVEPFLRCDDEPSLSLLDDRMSQKRWALPDRDGLYCTDAEHDEAEHEVGVEDQPHDPEQGW
jgi:hypothetical protein